MKGLEYKMIYGLIILLVVIVLIVIVVFYPSLNFKNTVADKQSFEDFCVFWSLQGYNKQLAEVQADSETYDIDEKCALALKTIIPNRDSCVKCCKKEIIC